MANSILHKRSSVAGVVPAASSLLSGEVAINTADGKVYTKTDAGAVVLVGPSAGGAASIPELTVDPVSPAAGYTWVLKNVTAPVGSPMGLLLAITRANEVADYKLKYKTNSGAIVGVVLA